MAFTRKSLAALGLNKETIDKVMALHGTSLADFVSKSELKAQIDDAASEAKKSEIISAIRYNEYCKLFQKEFNDYKYRVETLIKLKTSGVKDKFIENVYQLIKKDRPVAEQLIIIRKKYEEYFTENNTFI